MRLSYTPFAARAHSLLVPNGVAHGDSMPINYLKCARKLNLQKKKERNVERATAGMYRKLDMDDER